MRPLYTGAVLSLAWIFFFYIIGRAVDRNDAAHFWTGMAFWCFIPALYLLWFGIRLLEHLGVI